MVYRTQEYRRSELAAFRSRVESAYLARYPGLSSKPQTTSKHKAPPTERRAELVDLLREDGALPSAFGSICDEVASRIGMSSFKQAFSTFYQGSLLNGSWFGASCESFLREEAKLSNVSSRCHQEFVALIMKEASQLENLHPGEPLPADSKLAAVATRLRSHTKDTGEHMISELEEKQQNLLLSELVALT